MDGITEQKRPENRPNLIGTAEFANGTRLSVWRGRSGAFVRNETTGDVHRSNTIEAAWRNVRYIAGISQRSERTA